MMKPSKWLGVFAALTLVFTSIFGFVGGNSADAATSPYKIEIDKKTNYLYLYKAGKIIKTYRVATGRTKSLTPEGTFRIIIKISQPGWTNSSGKTIPGGDPKNPLGARWLGMQVNGDKGRTYGIHGTNNPSSIGTHASSGCVRMHNNDVINLYNTVPTGTLVWIHYGKHDGIWHGRHLDITSKSSTPASSKLTVTASIANIRATASLKGKVVQKVPRGTVLNKVGASGDFHKIKLKSGAYAYIHKSVVK
jgi:hypothetical protein